MFQVVPQAPQASETERPQHLRGRLLWRDDLNWYSVDDLLESGRLLRPLSQSLQTEFGYYLIYRESLQADPLFQRLQEWLTGAFDNRDRQG